MMIYRCRCRDIQTFQYLLCSLTFPYSNKFSVQIHLPHFIPYPQAQAPHILR